MGVIIIISSLSLYDILMSVSV